MHLCMLQWRVQHIRLYDLEKKAIIVSNNIIVDKDHKQEESDQIVVPWLIEDIDEAIEFAKEKGGRPKHEDRTSPISSDEEEVSASEASSNKSSPIFKKKSNWYLETMRTWKSYYGLVKQVRSQEHWNNQFHIREMLLWWPQFWTHMSIFYLNKHVESKSGRKQWRRNIIQ